MNGNNRRGTWLLWLGLSWLLSIALGAQSTAEKYIEEWAPIAVQNMNQYGIPASIILAQGILESGSGQSDLAREANNHFGIKCHRDWNGRKVYKDDDAKDECFRAYRKAQESFDDHAEFLKTRSRYAALFELNPTDYKAWAKGLKKAGYATNPKYDKLLIDLIDRYQLHRYDVMQYNPDDQDDFQTVPLLVNRSDNGVKYVIVRPGDSFERIAELTDRRVEELMEYNELRYDDSLSVGQFLYLQPKRRRSARAHKTHKIAPGESMHQIAQRYAIRMSELYQRNQIKAGEQAAVGRVLKLR